MLGNLCRGLNRMDALMHEGELPDRRRGEHERIKVRLPHAAVDRVHGEGERKPGIDDAVHLGAMRVKVDDSGKPGTLRYPWPQAQPECARGFKRIDHMEI